MRAERDDAEYRDGRGHHLLIGIEREVPALLGGQSRCGRSGAGNGDQGGQAKHGAAAIAALGREPGAVGRLVLHHEKVIAGAAGGEGLLTSPEPSSRSYAPLSETISGANM